MRLNIFFGFGFEFEDVINSKIQKSLILSFTNILY